MGGLCPEPWAYSHFYPHWGLSGARLWAQTLFRQTSYTTFGMDVRGGLQEGGILTSQARLYAIRCLAAGKLYCINSAKMVPLPLNDFSSLC